MHRLSPHALHAAHAHGALQPTADLLHGPRRQVARALRRLGAALSLAARRVARPARPVGPACDLPTIEFHAVHADAGAPEGALFIDGQYVGQLDVSRL